MHSSQPPRPLAVLLLAAGVAACDRQATLPGPPPVLAPAPEVHAYLPSVVDAGSRVVPGLSDTQTAGKIGAQLSLLDRLLVERDAARVRDALRTLRNLLSQYAPAARTADGAELSAIELVIEAVERLISEPAS